MMKRLVTLALVAAAAACSGDDDAVDIGPRASTSAALKTFESCTELAEKLRANLREESRTMLLQYLDEDYYSGYAENGVEDAETSTSTNADSAEREEGVDYSGTNNQESGVDEADFVKTDGYHIYVLNGNSLVIVGVPEFGTLDQEGSLQLEGYPSEMLLAGDTLVVFSQIYPQYLDWRHPIYSDAVLADGSTWRTSELTKMTFIDVSDRALPVTKRELYIEGWYGTSRKVDTSIRVISYAYTNLSDVAFYPELPENYWQLDWSSSEARTIRESAVNAAIEKNDTIIAAKPLSDFIPNTYERTADGVHTRNFAEASCANFAIADDSFGRGVTSIVSFDTTKDDYEADHIVSNSSVVYASTDTLVIAEPAQNYWWYYGQDQDTDDATNVHRFDIATPGVSIYTGSGRVPGALSSQFQLSENDGVVRVSTTSNQWSRWWVENPPPISSNVFTLRGDDGDLGIVGELRGISEGEQLWATRFTTDTAYLVTFRNVDPLWTVDLTDPANLHIVSELEVPGVSTYVHPLDAGRLLSIGIAGDDQGLDWGSTQVSLFNVADPAAPSLAAALSLSISNGYSWTYSEALYEHKAFQYWQSKGLLAVPLATYRYDSYGYNYYSSLELVSVGADSLVNSGSIDHSAFFDDPSIWWYNPGIRRSIFMGDYIVAISARGITATHLGDYVQTDSVRLPGDETPYWFY